MNGTRRRRIVALLGAAGLFLAACSSGGTAGTAARPAVSSSVAMAPSTTTLPASPSSSSSRSTSTSTSVPSEVPTEPAATPTGQPGTRGLPDVGLPGVNAVGCVSDRPPVLLLHGTLSTIAIDYPALAAALTAAGRCVYGADYGLYGTQAVRTSAAAFAEVVATVRTGTGAAQVDVVGFSQGGLVLRTALRQNGLADAVRVAVLISPSFHGTTSRLVTLPGAACPACADQAAGSTLLTELDAVAVTAADQIVTPWESQIPDGPADRVRSVVLEQQCPTISIRHQDMSRDPGVVGWTVSALDNSGDVNAADYDCAAGTG